MRRRPGDQVELNKPTGHMIHPPRLRHPGGEEADRSGNAGDASFRVSDSWEEVHEMSGIDIASSHQAAGGTNKRGSESISQVTRTTNYEPVSMRLGRAFCEGEPETKRTVSDGVTMPCIIDDTRQSPCL